MQPGFSFHNFYYEKKTLMFWLSITTVPSCVWVKIGLQTLLFVCYIFQVLQTIECARVLFASLFFPVSVVFI